MGLVYSIYLITFALSAIGWGYLADKFSRKRLLIIATFIWSVFSLLIATASSYGSLISFLACSSLGIGAIIPVGYSLTSDLVEPQRRSFAFAWWSVAFAIGSGGGILVAGVYDDWRFPFLLLATCGLVLAIPLLFLSEPARGQSELSFNLAEKKDTLPYTYTINRDDLLKILRCRTNLYVILQNLPGFIPIGIISAWVITLFIRDYGMSKATASIASIIMFVGMFFGSLIFGALGDHWFKKDRRARVKLCLIMLLASMPLWIAVFCIPFRVAQDADIIDVMLLPVGMLMFIISILASSFSEGFMPNWLATLSDVNLPEHRGTISAMNTLASRIGSGIAPSLGGALSLLLGGNLRMAIIIGILFWIPALFLWTLALRSVEQDMHQMEKTLQVRAEHQVHYD